MVLLFADTVVELQHWLLTQDGSGACFVFSFDGSRLHASCIFGRLCPFLHSSAQIKETYTPLSRAQPSRFLDCDTGDPPPLFDTSGHQRKYLQMVLRKRPILVAAGSDPNGGSPVGMSSQSCSLFPWLVVTSKRFTSPPPPPFGCRKRACSVKTLQHAFRRQS